MTWTITDVETQPASDMRLLTAEEIEYVAGGKHGGDLHGFGGGLGGQGIGQSSALASVVANALASGASAFAEVLTRSVAIQIGNVSIAIGYTFGIAISVGGTSVVSTSGTASA